MHRVTLTSSRVRPTRSTSEASLKSAGRQQQRTQPPPETRIRPPKIVVRSGAIISAVFVSIYGAKRSRPSRPLEQPLYSLCLASLLPCNNYSNGELLSTAPYHEAFSVHGCRSSVITATPTINQGSWCYGLCSLLEKKKICPCLSAAAVVGRTSERDHPEDDPKLAGHAASILWLSALRRPTQYGRVLQKHRIAAFDARDVRHRRLNIPSKIRPDR